MKFSKIRGEHVKTISSENESESINLFHIQGRRVNDMESVTEEESSEV